MSSVFAVEQSYDTNSAEPAALIMRAHSSFRGEELRAQDSQVAPRPWGYKLQNRFGPENRSPAVTEATAFFIV